MKTIDVAVIGAGASGLSAAIHAARLGAKCVIFEKQKAPLRKVLASGNGQCNISHSSITIDRYYGQNTEACRSLFAKFDEDGISDFFRSVGIYLREKEDGRRYPWSMQSSTVENALLRETERLRIEIQLHRKIRRITRKKDSLTLETEGRDFYQARTVVLSCGSRAFGPLGGSSGVYDLALSLGHTVTELVPVLLPMNIQEKNIRRLEGIKWDTGVTLIIDGKKKKSAIGELLFTKYGISGPVVIEVSSLANRAVTDRENTVLELDFFPEMYEEELCLFLEPLFELEKKNGAAAALDLVLKKRMAPVLLEGMEKCPLRKAAHHLKHYPLTPGPVRSFDEAMACAGGIPLSEINTKTFESKKYSGVFISGEVLDIDGECGGYNLHFAWSSGAVAGTNAATSSLQNRL